MLWLSFLLMLGLFSVNGVVVGRLYRVRVWALSGLVRVLQRLDALQNKTKQKNEGITCKIADISSKTSQVWTRTNPLSFSLAALPICCDPPAIFYYIGFWSDDALRTCPTPPPKLTLSLWQPRRKLQLLWLNPPLLPSFGLLRLISFRPCFCSPARAWKGRWEAAFRGQLNGISLLDTPGCTSEPLKGNISGGDNGNELFEFHSRGNTRLWSERGRVCPH